MGLEEGMILAIYIFILLLAAVRFLPAKSGKVVRRLQTGKAMTIGTRQVQEDNYGMCQTQDGFMAVLADGMGKNYGGKISSQQVVDTMKEMFANYRSVENPFTAVKEWWEDIQQAEELVGTEGYLKDYMEARKKAAEKKHYLVEGAVLRCTRCTLEPKTPFEKEFQAPTGSDRVVLKTVQNKTAKNKAGQCFATIRDSQKFKNIEPFGNCENPPDRNKEEEAVKLAEKTEEFRALGTCRYMMELNDEWENLIQDTGYEKEPGVDLEKIKTITMEAILFCKHGGFIYPIDSGYIEVPDIDIMEAWINTVDDVGQWYVKNVHTYCHMTVDEIKANGGRPSTERGRKKYSCDLDGNLNGIAVYDDCSGFLWACLVQAGYFEDTASAYNSGQYLPGNEGGKLMEEAGFCWHPLSELGVDNLEKGDVLVKNGHVEIFNRFEGNIEYAWTWGNVYGEEPTKKYSTKSEVANSYQGVWRLGNG